MIDAIEKLISAQPHFHAWPDGRPANWSISPGVLRFIADRVKPGMNTLETGAGYTTVAFCAAGARHVAVTPDREQAARIRAWLEAEAVPADLIFVHESSDVALPAGEGLPDRLDFVLVDGAHRFPFAMVDFHYAESRVPVGGIVAVDDCLMPSVRILYDFLAGESDWRLVDEIGVTALFERLRKAENVWDWADQDINKGFHEQVTAGMGAEPETGAEDAAETEASVPSTGNAGDAAGPGRSLEIDLRGARLQMKSMTQQIRTLDRDLRAAQQTLRRTRDELWRLKNSRSYRLVAGVRDAVARPLRFVRRKLLRR